MISQQSRAATKGPRLGALLLWASCLSAVTACAKNGCGSPNSTVQGCGQVYDVATLVTMPTDPWCQKVRLDLRHVGIQEMVQILSRVESDPIEIGHGISGAASIGAADVVPLFVAEQAIERTDGGAPSSSSKHAGDRAHCMLRSQRFSSLSPGER